MLSQELPALLSRCRHARCWQNDVRARGRAHCACRTTGSGGCRHTDRACENAVAQAAARLQLHLDPAFSAADGALPTDMDGVVTAYQRRCTWLTFDGLRSGHSSSWTK